MSTAPSPSTTPSFHDQSIGLVCFGIFQILIGCFFGLMCVMVVAMVAIGPLAQASGAPPMDMRTMIPVGVFYFLLALLFLAIGIGSIRARRWAWTLTVVLSWIWLIVGLFGCVVYVFIMPRVFAAAEPDPKIDAATMRVIQIVSGSVIAFIYVLLPASFLLFYRRAAVRATCQWRDPTVPWTDRCPMPVLALSLILGLGALSMLPSALTYRCVMPLFGVLVSGAAGLAVVLPVTLVLAYAAWGTYRLKMAAWWTTLVLMIAGSVSSAVTFARVNIIDMYEKMGMPEAQIAVIRKMGIADSLFTSHIGMIAMGVLWLGYLLYVRRYFVRARAAGPNELAD